jgi:kynurenine formamidase
MRIIDLSLPIDNRMRGVDIAPRNRIESDGWNATTLTLYSHCGTHMDAPAHFLPEGRTIDQQDLKVTMGPALVVNLAPALPRQVLRVDDLSFAADQIRPGVRLLLRTDWHKRYPAPEYRDEMPCISVELAEWLVERRIALLGVEPPSVADVHNMQDLTDVHHTLLGGGVVIVEGLAHLDQISRPRVHFIALPLKVVAGDGSPVRALAIERNAVNDDQSDDMFPF